MGPPFEIGEAPRRLNSAHFHHLNLMKLKFRMTVGGYVGLNLSDSIILHCSYDECLSSSWSNVSSSNCSKVMPSLVWCILHGIRIINRNSVVILLLVANLASHIGFQWSCNSITSFSKMLRIKLALRRYFMAFSVRRLTTLLTGNGEHVTRNHFTNLIVVQWFCP